MRARLSHALGGLSLLLAMAVPHRVRADDAASPLRASILCEAPPAPGRFRCDVEVRVSSATLAWADVAVVKVDDFILPLRGRVGPRDASAHDADIYRWSLGFVAKGRGSGDVTVRVRAVVCHGSACGTVETDVSGRVVVGR
jgi:hypothetical protein